MKRIIVFLLFVVSLIPQPALAKSDQKMVFIYIAHDENTPTRDLLNQLQEYYKSALNYPEMYATIFYLSDEETPLVVEMNTGHTCKSTFDDILIELQSKRSHLINPSRDLECIQEIFSTADFLDAYGELAYRSIEWNFYINASFWQLGYNERIIAALYFIMEMQPLYESGDMTLNIYHNRKETIPYNPEYPFGEKGLCKSVGFYPMPY